MMQARLHHSRKAHRVPCPHCSDLFSPNGIKSHIKSCEKMPTVNQFIAMRAAGMTMRKMAAELEAGYGSLYNWMSDHLDELPVEAARLTRRRDGRSRRKYGRQGGGPAPPMPKRYVHGLTPLYGAHGGCACCPGLDECKIQVESGLWAQCELPDPFSVFAAVRDGLLALVDARSAITYWPSNPRTPCPPDFALLFIRPGEDKEASM